MSRPTPALVKQRPVPAQAAAENSTAAATRRWVGVGCVAAVAFAAGWLSRPGVERGAAAQANASPTAPVVSNKSLPTTLPSGPADAGREKSSLQAAIRAAGGGSDRAARLYEFAGRLREVAPAEFPALLTALRRTRGPETSEMIAMLCSVWARHDGPAAYTAARQMIATDGEYPALYAAITAWAQREPEKAQETLRAAGLTDLTSDELSALVSGWAAKDFAAAETFLGKPAAAQAGEEGMPAAMQRGYEAIARARLEADPVAALQWYDALDPKLREHLRQPMLIKLAAMDPALANQWLTRDATAQIHAPDLTPVLRGLQLDGFDRQFAWAKTPANAETRDAALAAVVYEGAATQLAPLGEWLATRTDDPSLGPAFSTYAIKLVQKSPSAALTWAQSLDQPALRQSTLNAVVSAWNSINPRAAREWAQQTKLVDWESLVR